MFRLISVPAALMLTTGLVLGQSPLALISGAEADERFIISTGSLIAASPSLRNLTSLKSEGRGIIADIQEASALITAYHVDSGERTRNRVIRGAIEGMLGTLDPHSSYLGPDEFSGLIETQRSEYSGIGTSIITYPTGEKPGTYIIESFRGSPAAAAGLRFGDRIVSVDGRPVDGLDADEVRSLVKGRTGTLVSIGILRPSGEALSVRLRRALVTLPSIADHYILRPGIGYVDAREGFSETTASELKAAIASLKRQGMKSLILDLRGNPGGILNQAVRVSELFLGAGEVILTQKGRYADDRRVWRSANPEAESMPLMVLVNSMTASAAEIVAGALQDHDRALILGETTFGKGLVQSVIELNEGSGLTLTTARYFTPSGRSIQRDYSTLDHYTYFTGRGRRRIGDAASEIGRTDRGRTVFGGMGIAPEISMLDETASFLTGDVDGGAFLAAVKLLYPVGGRVGSETTGLTKGGRLQWHEFRLPPALIRDGPQTLSGIRSERELRYLLATAQSGSARARRVLIEADAIVLRAVEEIRSIDRPQ